MVARICWECEAYSEMKFIEQSLTWREVKAGYDTVYLLHAAYVCTQCQALSIGRHATEMRLGMETMMAGGPKAWFPPKPLSKEFPDVPHHIAAAATEATMCRALGCNRAAGALARAVVEATAKDKGADGKNLGMRIDKMRDMHLIRPGTAEAAHEVRHFGNDMAHGDFVQEVLDEDADAVMDLMEELLQEVYQGPAKVARQQAKRLAGK